MSDDMLAQWSQQITDALVVVDLVTAHDQYLCEPYKFLSIVIWGLCLCIVFSTQTLMKKAASRYSSGGER